MGGATRMTLTTTVMVMETTGALQLIVPLMLTVFVAKARRRLQPHSVLSGAEPVCAVRLESCCGVPWLPQLHEPSFRIQSLLPARWTLTTP